jgi:hypothetical protein
MLKATVFRTCPGVITVITALGHIRTRLLIFSLLYVRLCKYVCTFCDLSMSGKSLNAFGREPHRAGWGGVGYACRQWREYYLNGH